MNRYFISVLFFCFYMFSFSQSPGGVGTGNLRGWFDASSGVTITSGSVSAWTDRSTIGDASQGTSAERPIQTSSVFNYNPAITFDGNDDNLDLIDRMATGATGASIYAVAKQTGTGRDSWGSVFNGQVNGPAWTGGGLGLVAANVGSTSHEFYIRDYNSKFVSFSITNGQPILMAGTWNGTTTNSVQAFKNGTSAGTDAYVPGTVGDAGSSWIGSGNGGGTNYCFYGDIGELIIYNTGLSTANNNKVMSYLAMKYGITLSIDYTNSAATTVYSTTGTYTNNIIGIGRDDGSGMIQRQSKNDNDTVRVYLSTLAATNGANTGSFGSDLSHVMIGADLGNMCASSSTSLEIPSGFSIAKRLAREWKVTNTNFGGTFSMDFKLNACAKTSSITVSDLRLLIDDDGNFAAGTNTSVASGTGGITITYANPVITISGISTSLIASGATKYITIGSVTSSTTPLPVELIDFNSISEGTYNIVTWKSEVETNFKHYELESSEDGINFVKIATIEPLGNPTNNSYSYLDFNFHNPITYYRLKMVDLDESYEYSSIISVEFENSLAKNIVVSPNPVSHELFIKLIAPQEKEAEISIQNLFGQLVYQEKVNLYKGSESIYIKTSDFANGTYIVNVTSGKSISEKVKIVIAK